MCGGEETLRLLIGTHSSQARMFPVLFLTSSMGILDASYPGPFDNTS
jgi:hypothetical protein